MTKDQRKSLIESRRELAHKQLLAAERLIEEELFRFAAGQLYYAALTMLRAALISRSIKINSHRGASRLLGLHLVQPELVSKVASKQFQELSAMRVVGDYEDDIEISQEDVARYTPIAKRLVTEFETAILK